VAFICQDSFYRPLSDKEKQDAARGDFNFDHPGNNFLNKFVHKNSMFYADAFEHELFINTIQQIRAGRPVDVPVYDFQTNSR
jgi:uridine kinase